MSSSSNNADLFNRLQLFRARSEDLEDEDGQRKRIDPSQSRVKRYIITQCEKMRNLLLFDFFYYFRCLFGRGNTEENIKFAKRELEKALEDSKKRWNFDFANERPLDGRFVWQTPPYPKILISKNEASAATNNSEIAEENSENVIPTEKKSIHSQISNTLKPSQNPSEINTHTSSSDDQNDQDSNKLRFQTMTATASSTSSTSSSSSSSEIPGPGSPSQRSSSRQSSISRKFYEFFRPF